jgi:hypothetical protein
MQRLEFLANPNGNGDAKLRSDAGHLLTNLHGLRRDTAILKSQYGFMGLQLYIANRVDGDLQVRTGQFTWGGFAGASWGAGLGTHRSKGSQPLYLQKHHRYLKPC